MRPLSLVALLAATTVVATPQQAPPATEVYLAPVQTGSRTTVGPWINISNNPGYDNQPSFLPDSSRILFTSMRDGKQTDIYEYDIKSQAVARLTDTPESEYSPTVTPDRKTFSVIRVESDGAQRLWRFNLDGSNPRLVLENVKPVGYHAWIDDMHLALFILGTGNAATLQVADTATGTSTVIETGIGRSVLIRPKARTVSYMTTGASRMVKEWNPETRTSSPVFAPLDGSQDAAWTQDGVLLMASGTRIMQRASQDAAWSEFANLEGTDSPVKSITRLAMSPDGKWLAFVAEPVVK